MPLVTDTKADTPSTLNAWPAKSSSIGVPKRSISMCMSRRMPKSPRLPSSSAVRAMV